MEYKTIATIYRDPAKDGAHLGAAIDMADTWGAHLHVLALGTDRTRPGAYYAGAEALALPSAISEAITEAKAAAEAARAVLANSNAAWEVTSAVSQIGALGQIIAQRVDLTDLAILPRPYDDGRDVEDVAIVEAALFSTRTPVLILPPGLDRAPRPENIVLAWNQSTESLAAIRASLPFLKAARAVNIAIVDPPVHDPDRSDPGGMLAEMLSRHGVRCDISVLARTVPRISEVIRRHAADIGSDMIVMGAYGHSRLREAILGGATRNMLEECRLPVLMAH